ncbi:hypothetical protein HCK00_16490 [Streptomyces sp. PLAI1-29]|uniref:Uncharacterized protein n=1 Tax=Streptomyces zingiberis TaxID=2053010 RepID=A0ABX1C064_9ACTN|nr:hypothetical protein [Streptomyces zingiberis]
MLAWNNPKLHTPLRRKTWLACEEHREHLSSFLGVRGFLKEVVPLADWQAREDTGGAGGAGAPEGTGGAAEPGGAPATGGADGTDGPSAADR